MKIKQKRHLKNKILVHVRLTFFGKDCLISRGHCDCKYDCTGETPRDEFGEFLDEYDSFDFVRWIGDGDGV